MEGGSTRKHVDLAGAAVLSPQLDVCSPQPLAAQRFCAAEALGGVRLTSLGGAGEQNRAATNHPPVRCSNSCTSLDGNLGQFTLCISTEV